MNIQTFSHSRNVTIGLIGIAAFVLAELLFFDRGTAGCREGASRGIMLVYP